IGSKSISITGQEHKNEKLPQKAQTSNGKLSASFSGNMKARKPLKSKGGSISTQWNNDGMPLQQKTRSKDTERATAYSGNLKAQKKPKGAGGSINVQWNNDGMPLQKLERSKDTGRATAYQGNMKATKPVHGGGSIDRGNWNNKGKSTNEKYISPATRIATRFTGKDKKKEIITEKRDDYVNFSGTIKVKKTKGGKDQHPSFYYVNAKNKQLNGKEEKEKKISLIVLWSKIFKRNGNQPSNLKEKPGKLEFDKREIGIWHE
ncbi:MAG: hypothetical protein OEY34_10475, partial [Cyclobacteriaceae bacterium]|nr:hypothetical protein [Cyclobacteriaceae bacterium]